MKCAIHPDRNAKYSCVSCKRPLCEDCAIEVGGGITKCMNCTFRGALQEINQRRQEKITSRKHKEVEKEVKKKKKAYLRVIIPISIGLAVAIVELLLYYRVTSVMEVEEFRPAEDPSAFAIVLDEAIRSYALDHGGVVPGRLQELLGRYLPREKIRPVDLEGYRYARTSPTSYTLEPMDMNGDLPVSLTFTDEGLEVGGAP
ncbi:MAG: B-box zinc finger protein [Deltaproteobacteria bacterium]|nr:B-box zinc finger protein [Deltaproteobacteria bacterium]MBW2136588.1 B-box zinc finger protein [Deltaproteobacteria bacterium]